jgi:hypothetical protein
VYTFRFRTAIPLALLLLAACGPSLPQPAAGPGGTSPLDAVDRFLRLADSHSYMEMGWIFGTEQGPVVRRDAPANVERRMAMIATILDNESFELSQPRPIPGRVGRAVQVDVRLRLAGGGSVVVPFTTVSGRQGRWYIENVGLEPATTRR